MPNEVLAAIAGGVIAIVAGAVATILTAQLSERRRRKSIRSVAAAEVTAIKEKAQRYIDGESTQAELGASTPLLTSIASELGFLSQPEVIALRRAVTLDMEMRKSSSKEKAALAVQACEEALGTLLA